MLHLSGWLFAGAAALYLAATAVSLWVLTSRRQEPARAIPWLAIVGLAVHLGGIVSRTLEEGGPPSFSLSEILILLGFGGISAYLFAHFRYRLEVVGVIIFPLVVSLMAVSLLVPESPPGAGPAWKVSLRAVHVVPAVLGVAFLFMTFATSVVYLIQDRGLKAHRPLRLSPVLPSLERCDRISYLSLGWGFAFLTFVVLTGALTNRYTGGDASWILREKWSMLAWVLFAVVIYDRVFAGRWRGRLSAYLSIVGFAAIILRMTGIGA